MNKTAGKTLVWITGASSGLGRAVAERYARDGHTVIASARSEDKLQQLANEVAASNADGIILPLVVDVTDKDSVTQAAQHIQSLGGPPDTVILNAGYYEPCSLTEISNEHFEKTMDVNFNGVVRCLFAVLPNMLQARKGHLVLVSSVAGYSGLPRAAAYGSSKAALIHLAESLKHECNAGGIDVSVINPGFVKTPLTDKNEFEMPFIMEVDDAAEAMYRGIKSRKFEVNFPKRFTWILKFLRILPYSIYFGITRRLL